jgi:hypothetical protein
MLFIAAAIVLVLVLSDLVEMGRRHERKRPALEAAPGPGRLDGLASPRRMA